MKIFAQKFNFSLIKTSLLVGIFFIATIQIVSAQGLGSELKEVEQTVKDTVNEVSKQLSGETQNSPTSDPETLEVIKQRLEKTVEESRVRGTVTTGTQKRGFIGEVVRVSEDAVTVSNGEKTNIITLEEVRILKESEEIELSEIVVGDWVIVLGLVDTDQVFIPKFIEVSTQDLSPAKKSVVIGSLTKISTSSIEILPRNQETTDVFSLIKSTEFQNADGESILASAFEVDTNVLVVGFEEEDSDGNVEKTASIIRSLAAL